MFYKIRLNQTYYDCCGKLLAEKGIELDVERIRAFPTRDVYEVASGELVGLWLNMSSCEVIGWSKGGKIVLEITRGLHIEFDYMNWKGVFGHRTIRVKQFYFGSTEYHPEGQWLLEGFDLDKDEGRIFAMKDMSNISYW
jgi:hypothetical protein